jgi:hypothetical protein
MLAQRLAKLNRDPSAGSPGSARPAAGGDILTSIIRLTFAIDGASQIALASTLPTGSLATDSTTARIVVLHRPDHRDLVPPPPEGAARERPTAAHQHRAPQMVPAPLALIVFRDVCSGRSPQHPFGVLAVGPTIVSIVFAGSWVADALTGPVGSSLESAVRPPACR